MDMERFIMVKRIKENDDDHYTIECPKCDRDSPIIGVNEDNEAFHKCPEHGIFLITFDGSIFFVNVTELI